MASADFIYEHKVSSCPITEEQAFAILCWMEIGPNDAFKYMGLSTSRAVLYRTAAHLRSTLNPPQYISPCEPTGR